MTIESRAQCGRVHASTCATPGDGRARRFVGPRYFRADLVPNSPLQQSEQGRLSDLPDHESPTCDGSIAGGVPSSRDETSRRLPLGAREAYGTIPVSELASRVTSLCMDKSRGTWPREGLRSGSAKRRHVRLRRTRRGDRRVVARVSRRQPQDHVLYVAIVVAGPLVVNSLEVSLGHP
jgi:hypothetical protein